MRNMAEYPVTYEEIIEKLRYISYENKDRIGDMTPMMMNLIEKFLNENEEEFKEFIEEIYGKNSQRIS